jgi:hypothetical protein
MGKGSAIGARRCGNDAGLRFSDRLSPECPGHRVDKASTPQLSDENLVWRRQDAPVYEEDLMK